MEYLIPVCYLSIFIVSDMDASHSVHQPGHEHHSYNCHRTLPTHMADSNYLRYPENDSNQ